jgi:hypothetical protein
MRMAGVVALVCGLVLTVALVSSGSSGPSKTDLAMMGDIATINDIHSAYIHGSVPTAVGESNDIMDLNFPDEVGMNDLVGMEFGGEMAGAGEGREVLWMM